MVLPRQQGEKVTTKEPPAHSKNEKESGCCCKNPHSSSNKWRASSFASVDYNFIIVIFINAGAAVGAGRAMKGGEHTVVVKNGKLLVYIYAVCLDANREAEALYILSLLHHAVVLLFIYIFVGNI